MQRQSHSSTVFDLDYLVIIGGIYQFDESALMNIRYSRSAGNKGLYGTVTQGFSFECYSSTDLTIQEDMTVTFSATIGQFSTFYVSEVQKSGNVYSVTAYDRCKNLDIPFDVGNRTLYTSDQVEKNSDNYKKYTAADIMGDLAHQAGFHGAPALERITEFIFTDFSNKTCRQILEEVSLTECGIFYCDTGNDLNFMKFDPDGSGNSFTINANNRTEVNLQGTKTISAIYAVNEVTGETVSEAGDWKNTEELSGRYQTTANIAQVKAQIFEQGGSYAYHGWNVDRAVMQFIQPLNACLYYDNKYLPCLNQNYEFGVEVTATLGAEKPDLSYVEYMNKQQRDNKENIKKDQELGVAKFNDENSGIVWDVKVNANS